MRFFQLLAIAALLVLAACGTTIEDRTASGAGIGAGTGAAVGAIFGGIGAGPGALIGAAVGGGAGALTGPAEVDLGRPVWR
jgi:osmotically inducible lipoprotein OsmB